MNLLEVLENLKESVEKFLIQAVTREEEEHFIDQKVRSLEDIVRGRNKDSWLIKDRFRGLETWLKTEGAELNSRSVKKKQIQKIIECIERMKYYWDMLGDGKKAYPDGMKILTQANSFVRDNLRRRGLEYTPLGLVDFVQWDETLLKLREEIGTIEEGEADLKSKYHKTLTYQLDLMDYLYKPGDHLLTILDYQLKNLETSLTREDELFVASLIYYLKQKQYKVEPYLERFRKALKRQKRA